MWVLPMRDPLLVPWAAIRVFSLLRRLRYKCFLTLFLERHLSKVFAELVSFQKSRFNSSNLSVRHIVHGSTSSWPAPTRSRGRRGAYRHRLVIRLSCSEWSKTWSDWDHKLPVRQLNPQMMWVLFNPFWSHCQIWVSDHENIFCLIFCRAV